jgi:hypothetical protein
MTRKKVESLYPEGLYPENRPQWKDAPKWAKWLALNDSGYWYWFSQKPKIVWVSLAGKSELAGVGPIDSAVREGREMR